MCSRLPVLLQGDTSVGKTSLITYLARITGNRCYRINNHEHTDIQEYLGCYTASERSGRLVFNYGSCQLCIVVLFCEGLVTSYNESVYFVSCLFDSNFFLLFTCILPVYLLKRRCSYDRQNIFVNRV